MRWTVEQAGIRIASRVGRRRRRAGQWLLLLDDVTGGDVPLPTRPAEININTPLYYNVANVRVTQILLFPGQALSRHGTWMGAGVRHYCHCYRTVNRAYKGAESSLVQSKWKHIWPHIFRGFALPPPPPKPTYQMCKRALTRKSHRLITMVITNTL